MSTYIPNTIKQVNIVDTILNFVTNRIKKLLNFLGGSPGGHRYYLQAGETFNNKQGNEVDVTFFSIISDNSSLTTSINPYKQSNPITTTGRTAGLSGSIGFNRVTFPTPDGVGYTIYVASTSASDTNPSGTGARQLYVQYIDKDWNAQTTYVNLNGTTPIALTPTDIIRINRAQISSVGSDHTNRGDICFSTDAPVDWSSGLPTTNVINCIARGYSYTAVAIHTTPLHTMMFYTRGSYYCAANNNQLMNYQELDTFPWDSNNNRITWCTGCLTVSASTAYETACSAASFPCNDVEFVASTDNGTLNSNVFWNCEEYKDTDNF